MDRICRAEPEPAERPASGAARGLGEEGGGGENTRRSFGDLLSNLQIYRALSYRLTGHRTPSRRAALIYSLANE